MFTISPTFQHALIRRGLATLKGGNVDAQSTARAHLWGPSDLPRAASWAALRSCVGARRCRPFCSSRLALRVLAALSEKSPSSSGTSACLSNDRAPACHAKSHYVLSNDFS